MELRTEQLSDGVERISLVGRLDSAGVQDIDMRFTTLMSTRKVLAVVDLSEVSFLASIGIRTLVTNARAQGRRGGAMALAGARPLVAEVLKTAGVEGVIPIYPDVDAASSALKAADESQ